MERPLPQPDADSAPFWEACGRHELRVQRCADCGSRRHPPRPRCPDCGSFAVEWERLSGRGEVYSWVVAHPPVLPAFQERVPTAENIVQAIVWHDHRFSTLLGCRVMTRLGYIGLGIMGRGMAANLIQAGHPLTVWNRTRSKADGLDVAVVDTPGEIGPETKVVTGRLLALLAQGSDMAAPVGLDDRPPSLDTEGH